MDDFVMASLEKKPLGDVNTSWKLKSVKSLRSVGVVFVFFDVHLLKGEEKSFKIRFAV